MVVSVARVHKVSLQRVVKLLQVLVVVSDLRLQSSDVVSHGDGVLVVADQLQRVAHYDLLDHDRRLVLQVLPALQHRQIRRRLQRTSPQLSARQWPRFFGLGQIQSLHRGRGRLSKTLGWANGGTTPQVGGLA